MNKIRFAANADTNYVFHMLSAAKCGYDNDYGAKYRALYPPRDLAAIKSRESLLTVRGGEHCGELFGMMVCTPACAEASAFDYYAELLKTGREILDGKLPDGLNTELLPYTDDIIAVSEVMTKHYDGYINDIWPREKEKIERYIPPLRELFESRDFTEAAEKLVGSRLRSEFFTATLVTSVQNGAEAIDISRDQDMFGIERDKTDAFYFIGHEFIIYLLFGALDGENAFRGFDTWAATEGLAEYYLKKLTGDARFFDSAREYADLYARLAEHKPMSAVELYKAALETKGLNE